MQLHNPSSCLVFCNEVKQNAQQYVTLILCLFSSIKKDNLWVPLIWKCCPYHDASSILLPLWHNLSLFSKIVPIRVKAIWSIKLSFIFVRKKDFFYCSFAHRSLFRTRSSHALLSLGSKGGFTSVLPTWNLYFIKVSAEYNYKKQRFLGFLYCILCWLILRRSCYRLLYHKDLAATILSLHYLHDSCCTSWGPWCIF